MLDFLEETVGRAWHRVVCNTRTSPRYREHAVRLAKIRPVLAICFGGFGGESTVQPWRLHSSHCNDRDCGPCRPVGSRR